MTKIALGLAYAGQSYAGWQRQKTHHSVQEALENALSKVAAHPIDTVCAGRTDAGVHAALQVVHFETNVQRTQEAWVRGTNTYLAEDIRVMWAKEVEPSFHARFSATGRRYRYVIDNGRQTSPLLASRVSGVRYPLDIKRMQEAANHWVGEHDFSAFRASRCQAHSPVRDVRYFKIWSWGRLIFIDVEANAFLYHMIRNFVGTLLLIGAGQWAPSAAQTILQSRDRQQAGDTASAHGLYFLGPLYPESYRLPSVRFSGGEFLFGLDEEKS